MNHDHDLKNYRADDFDLFADEPWVWPAIIFVCMTAFLVIDRFA